MLKKLTNRQSILIILILLLAAFLRLYRIQDYMTFLGDEGRDVIIAYNILHGHFTLLGPTASVGGFFLGPIYYYFMAPFLLLFHFNPVGPAVMVALSGIFTVWLVYQVSVEFFDKNAAFVTALLYCLSPIVISYSHSSWNPNLMPMFSLLTLYLLYRGVVRRSTKLLIVSGVLFGILMQLHYIEVFLGITIASYIAITAFVENRKEKILFLEELAKKYAFLFFGFLIGFSPFLAFEARHGFPNIRSVVTFVLHSQQDASGNFFGTVGDVLFRLFGRLVVAYPIQDKLDKHLFSHIMVWNIAIWLLAILSLSIFLFGLYKIGKKRVTQSPLFYQQLLLFLWLFFGVILFGFYKKPIYDYYFQFMFPLPFLLVGNAFSFFFKREIYWKGFAIVSLLCLLTVNILWNPLKFSPNMQMNQIREIATFVLSKTNNKPFNFALMATGNSDHAYRYFLMILGHPPVMMQNLIEDPKRTSVTDQLLLVCELEECKPLGYPLFEVADFGRANIAGQWNVSHVKVLRLTHYKGTYNN